jgi:cation:H+ antiporter
MQAIFGSLALWQLITLFVISAGAVWFGGSRLAGYVDAITDRTGLGQAFIGMLLLGGITSLPEVAAVSTSAAAGNAPLAVNNLLGTASINILLLALADFVYGREALTAVAARPVTLMQGVLSMLLATAVAMIATVGDVALFGVGAGALVLALGAVVALWLSSDFEHRHVWEVVGDGEEDEAPRQDERSTIRLATYIALCALLILAAGFVLSTTADRIAQETGVGAGMVGFVLVGFATSLPEVSSITAAVRMKRYQLAIGDVFGTNIFNIMLIFLADLVYRGGPVLGQAGRFEVIGAILAVFMTGIFIVGLLERRNRTIFRMGYDALASILVFAAGLWFLSRAMG